MRSATQQLDVDDYRQDAETMNPARPEPFMPERLSSRYDSLFTESETPRHGASARTMLAAAFEKLGRGVPAAAAAEQSREFYRSSGHRWTLGLSGKDA